MTSIDDDRFINDDNHCIFHALMGDAVFLLTHHRFTIDEKGCKKIVATWDVDYFLGGKKND